MRLPYAFSLIAMTIAGCSGGSTPVNPESADAALEIGSSAGEAAGSPVELRFDEAVEFGDLELKWLAVEDSRCPIGVTCIWAGQMVVKLELKEGGQEPVEIDLLRRVGDEPEAKKTVGYELRLLDVQPPPREGQTPERGDYVALVEIAKL